MKVRVTQIDRVQLCIPNRVSCDKNELYQIFDTFDLASQNSIRVNSWFSVPLRDLCVLGRRSPPCFSVKMGIERAKSALW
jgi:hypothetical protein